VSLLVNSFPTLRMLVGLEYEDLICEFQLLKRTRKCNKFSDVQKIVKILYLHICKISDHYYHSSCFSWYRNAMQVLICGLLGIPPSNGVLPQAPMHTRSLAVLRRQVGDFHRLLSVNFLFTLTLLMCRLFFIQFRPYGKRWSKPPRKA
jgi:hypothetical protein